MAEKLALTLDKARKYMSGWFHMLEMTLCVELLGYKRKKDLKLEYGSDDNCYQIEEKIKVGKTQIKTINRIHIGLGFFKEAKDKRGLFNDIFYVLGHEMQHLLSTTQKDWDAANNGCFRWACQKLATDILGRPALRLTRDSDYEHFFKDLSAAGVYLNIRLLRDTIHSILNILEDGRIELLREKKHPGFRVYRKIFRSRQWLKDDIRDMNGFKEDVKDLSPAERYFIVQGQMYYLATMGIYQRGFLAAYGGTDLHDDVVEIIPNISRAVLSRSCRGCMDEGRAIFEKYFDTIIDICRIPAEAAALQAMLAQLLQALMMGEAENSSFSASTRNEEQGDGKPGESLFGQTVLEIEVDKETFEKMKKEAEENDESMSGLSVRVKLKGEDTEEGDKGESGKGNGSGDGDKSDEDNASSSGSSGGSGETGESDENGSPSGTSEGSEKGEKEERSSESKDKSKSGSDKDGDKKDESEEEGGEKTGDKSQPDNSGKESAEGKDKSSESKGHNNYSDGADDAGMTDDELEALIRDQMEAAANAPSADFDCAEADAKKDEEFKDAAEKLKPVEPKKVDLKPVNENYDENVSFLESTRVYTPTLRLPFDIEDKGRSLSRKIEDIIKSKQIPNRRHLKSGLLDSRKLPGLAMGETDIFKKKGEKVKAEVAAYVLIDNSGSMGNGEGSTRYAVCNAAAVLEEGFKKHAPLKIAAFDASGSSHVTHEVIKEFDEVASSNLAYNFKHLGRSGGGNKDGYSIRVATQQLMSRAERNKVLIIASDGLPSDYRGGFEAGIADVKAAVTEARRLGIRTVGMYMYHEQREEDFALFKDMYAPEIIFASLDEIEDELVRILRQYF